MEYKIMTQDPINKGWEDDSFASGWAASYCTLTRDGDIAKLKTDAGYPEGWIEKSGFSVNVATYKYLVACLKGTHKFFIEIYDGAWKSVTGGHVDAPSEYDIKIYDLSGISTGTVTNIRLGVGDLANKEAYYDFVGFWSYQPWFPYADKVLMLSASQDDNDVDEFEIIGTEDVGGGLTVGRHAWIWLKGSIGEKRKVFAGVVEEVTPEDTAGQVLKITGRCFGQKLLLRTKSKKFSGREVSLAVKDFVEDFDEITSFQVETPSPAVNITKDYNNEYISDGLKDLAKQAGSDWEVKLGMGNDLRFRSRASGNVPTLPIDIKESDGHILRGVKKGSDGYRAYNKVTVLGGPRSNIDGDPDKYTDQGDVSTYGWTGGTITESSEDLYYGLKGIDIVWSSYANVQYARFTIPGDGIDLTLFRYARFMHKGDTPTSGVYGIQPNPAYPSTTWYFQLRLEDWMTKIVSATYLPDSAQPPRAYKEIIVDFADMTGDSDSNWVHVKYVYFRVVSNRTEAGEGVRGRYQLDKFNFYTPNITKSATTADTDFRHTREYICRDEKLVDPSYVQQVANALLLVVKSKENRYRLPLIGMPFVQVGHKANVVSPTHELNGTYYITEAEHKVTPGEGYMTEMTLEKPRLSLERLLAEAIERKIKLIERGGIA